MNARRIGKIAISTLVLAATVRLAGLGYEVHRQNGLAAEVCGLVALPIGTGLVRDTYDGIENALRANGEAAVCVNVTDKGRGYSPDCFRPDATYRTVICRSEANTGIRAALSFESHGLLEWPLAYTWLGIFLFIAALIELSGSLAKYAVEVYTAEVNALLHSGSPAVGLGKPPWPLRIARLTMQKTGISARLAERAALFHEQLAEYEKRITSEASARSRLEQERASTKAYVEKVKEIRHDIRSPLSSLQAIYEKLKANEAATTKALATAIRRIQLLMDDLNQVDRIREEPKLVIAEVVAEEVALLIAPKFKEAKSATVELEYFTESLSPIMVGEKEFQAAIENLLENAFDAISHGGRIKLLVGSDGGQCTISVADDGCGVSPENIGKLFSRGGTFGKINGLGLGLFHTKQNIEAWGGAIACTPLERGTRFTITIPLTQTGVVFSGLPKDQRLKVIDDDRLVPDALRKAGFEILEAASTYADGRAVLARGTSEDFSILVDQRLDGDKLGTDLIAQQPGRRKVFLCTNDFDDLEIVRLARAVGVKIIPKPLCFFSQYRPLLVSPSPG